MSRTDQDYWEDLTMQLRLAGMSGDEIGAILEESKDHLHASGEAPADAFGPADVYAAALGRSRGHAAARGLDLTRGDLLAAAAQIGAWGLLVYGIAALADPAGLALHPGLLSGWLVLTLGFVWPVWPAVRAFTLRRVGAVRPVLAMTAVVGASVWLAVAWTAPVLVHVPAALAIVVAVAVIALCWWRAWHLRDPVRRPVAR